MEGRLKELEENFARHIFFRGSMTKTPPSLDSNQSSSTNESSACDHSATATARGAAEISHDNNVKMVTNDKSMFVTGRNNFTIIAKIMLTNHTY